MIRQRRTWFLMAIKPTPQGPFLINPGKGLLMNKAPNIFSLVFVATLLVFFRPAFAPCETQVNDSEPRLNATLDRQSATVGSIVTLTLDYHLPEGARLEDKAGVQGLGDLTVVEKTLEPGRITIRFLVDKLDLLKTNSLSLTYLDREENTQTITADPVSLEVPSNLGDKPEEAHLKPIQDIIPTRALWLKYLPWGASAAGILVLLAATYWWYRNKRIRTLSPEVMDPPHLRAKKELKGLISQNLFEKGEVKRFYFHFSEILRRYLATLRGFPAVELTTEEIALTINNEKDRTLIPLLRGADLVKFADAVPTSAKKDDEVQRAFAYIGETTPSQEGVPPVAIGKQFRRQGP